jgi:glycosyltransferase involved in cell wall biosynthesis
MKRLKLLTMDFNLPYFLRDADYPVGGATVEWSGWIEGFKQNGVRVGVLTWKGAREFISKSVDMDIVETYDLKAGIPRLRWLYQRFPALLRAAKSYRPDFVIQEVAGAEPGVMRFISRQLRVPFVYRSANDIDADDRYKKRLNAVQQVAFRYGLKGAALICCQNSYQYQRFRTMFPEKKVIKIHNPYFSRQDLADVPGFSARKYVAWIGIFQYQKNLPGLYEVVKSMPGVQFKIAGKPGGEALDDDTTTALSGLRGQKNAEFVGFLKRTEVLPFLSRSYALLNTSHYEGFSNTFLEAFAAGTPIVTTEKVDPDHIIADHALGIVRQRNADLHEALLSLLEDEDSYEGISARCREYVKKNHDPKTLAGRWLRAFRSLGAGGCRNGDNPP